MPLPAVLTNLRAVPDTQEGVVRCFWTNPTDTLTATKIELALAASGNWIVQYNAAPVAKRVLYELATDREYDIRVSSQNATGWSAPALLRNVALGGRGMAGCPLWLFQWSNPALSVNLGAYENEDSTALNQFVRASWFDAMGQQFDRKIVSRKQYHQGALEFLLVPNLLEDGTVDDPWRAAEQIETWAAGNNALLLRDLRTTRYGKVESVFVRSYLTSMVRAGFTFKEVAPPPGPLTS